MRVICVCLALVAASGVVAHPLQTPLLPTDERKKLHGRFLHITDMHPDPYYRAYASESSSCHRQKPKKEKERAGYYGTPFGQCDSPFELTNFTLDYLDTHWSSEIDFVIWTGDNARHDNDRKLPRTPSEIYELNRVLARKMADVFTRKGIPVVPSLGNNDVWPHNIMTAGPNSITNEFSSIWSTFIPFHSYQVFQRGAYFSVEVIPDQIGVISLNTMYFFESNKAVGGCEYKDAEDAGNLEFDWLEVQLNSFRDRHMLVWITGHVPPSPGNYYPECFVRYVELSLRFQDTILGHLYGHMNTDHFFVLEAGDLELDGEKTSVGVLSRDKLYKTLVADFGAIPNITNSSGYDNYAIINVTPSVIPNPYVPSFRIFAYNNSGVEVRTSGKKKGKKGRKRKHGHRHGHGDKDRECKKGEYKDTWRCRLESGWHSDADAASRRNVLWSPLGYAQYYVPHLEVANETAEPRFELEYVTFARGVIEGEEGPIPRRHLPVSLEGYVPYGMRDLTIPSWISVAQAIGSTDSRLREVFKRFMYFV